MMQMNMTGNRQFIDEKKTHSIFFWMTHVRNRYQLDGKKQIKRKYQAKAAADKKLSHV